MEELNKKIVSALESDFIGTSFLTKKRLNS